MRLLIKSGREIKDIEFRQIKEAYFREFKEGPSRKKGVFDHTFFLLVERKKILAIGSLIPVQSVKFNKEAFNILGIGGIVSNEKRKGYGKKIMTAIKKYLEAKNKSGVGFCGEYNNKFYEKCGFKIDKSSFKRFVHWRDNKKIINKGDDHILYLDSSDNFMKKVLLNRNEDVLLPRPPDW